ncbi:MAG: site-specific integrase [Lachnospiraceae bacterium]|nr:site-specific integrase [Lachnospiraceae bacterium]
MAAGECRTDNLLLIWKFSNSPAGVALAGEIFEVRFNEMSNGNKTTQKRRKKGQGSITKKKNGTYLGRISVAGYEPYSCVGATKKEVEKKLEEFRIRTLRREVIPKQISVSDYIENWLENVKKPALKPASFDRLEGTYRNHIRNTQVGRSQMGNIRAMDIQKLINEESKMLSYSSLKKIYELLNDCLCYAVISRELDYNPMQAVCMPKQENLSKQTKQIQIYTQEELKRMEEATKITYATGESRFKHAALFVLIANTGLREGEAVALTWKDVDFKRKLIHVRSNASCVKDREGNTGNKYKVIITTVKTKNGIRTIPCNEKAMEALNWLKKFQEEHHIHSQYVDCNKVGDIIKPYTLPKIFKSILEAMDVTYKGIHSLRHTFASNLIAAGVDIKIVSQLLGHASVKITYDTYVHTNLENAYAAVNKLNNV